MALLDYFKGPQHKARSVQLKAELSAMKERCSQLQALAKRYGATDVVEVQRKIAAEMRKLKEAKQAVVQAEQEVAMLATQVKQLRN